MSFLTEIKSNDFICKRLSLDTEMSVDGNWFFTSLESVWSYVDIRESFCLIPKSVSVDSQ